MSAKSERVQCTHCRGSGMCQMSTLVKVKKPDGNYGKAFICSNCGQGAGYYGFFSEGRYPVCRVCGGRGWHAYDPALPPVVYR